jgi:dTDP-4-dehydrorhamnose reductase
MNTIEQEYEYVVKIISSCTNVIQLEYARNVLEEFKQRWTIKQPITDQKLPRMIENLKNLDLKKYKELST